MRTLPRHGLHAIVNLMDATGRLKWNGVKPMTEPPPHISLAGGEDRMMRYRQLMSPVWYTVP